MPGRKWIGGDKYRYTHNGQEREDELYAGAQSAENWMYDSRILRRWEIDPITYKWQSPYACFNNNPVYFADPQGLEGVAVEGAAEGAGSMAAEGEGLQPPDRITMEWDEESGTYKETGRTETPDNFDTYNYKNGTLDGEVLTHNKTHNSWSWGGGENGSAPAMPKEAAPKDNTSVAPRPINNGSGARNFSTPFDIATQAMWRLDNWATSYTDRLIIWGTGMGNNPNAVPLKRTGGLYKTVDFGEWVGNGIAALRSNINGNNYVAGITNNGSGTAKATEVGKGIGNGWVEANTQPAGVDQSNKPAIGKATNDTVLINLSGDDTVKTTYDKDAFLKSGGGNGIKPKSVKMNGKEYLK